MTTFTEVSVKVDGEAAEAVAEVLRPFAFQEGVVLEQYGAADNPDPLALEPDITVKIFITQQEDQPDLRRRIEEILYHLNRLYPVPQPTFRILEETDWTNAWKEHYKPFRVGERIWIQPSWYDSEQDAQGLTDAIGPGDIVLLLDPGMAFGTGLHPTTQQCLSALDQVIKPGENVLDVGTGSGILSIAAIKLGAASAVGIDTDFLAVKSALANAQQNDIEQSITFWQGDLQSVDARDWDVIVVNILAPVIEELLLQHHLMDYLAKDGWLILSGIIDSQLSSLEKIIARTGGTIARTIVIRDWVTLMVRNQDGK